MLHNTDCAMSSQVERPGSEMSTPDASAPLSKDLLTPRGNASHEEEASPNTATPYRSRKSWANDAGRIQEYKRLQDEFNNAEDRRQERENATLEKWMKVQQETEERRFRMLQEEHAATNIMQF
ncbi:hypothetical protein PO909_002834 [Leuciscus waleckii]